ncbi:MAG: acyl carrier protein [Gomphosphaeria aponina SAG 52.96 = DSM 107014]|uniref:Acyl carrier protein n=1 Tax=Gomphosphaeria aponina SAG 52.96 = DSM 107014 TaxID=1521640 RepID=A0A941GWI6_9CHRO|nr:acyl carrier protein [Gomphosphaeria aponina SAG 52.96 = DSM 107014]
MESKNTQISPRSEGLGNNNVEVKGNVISPADIQSWLVSYLAELLEIEPDEIDISIPFERYGLDSSAAVVLTGDLQDWLEKDIDPTILFDYPTIETLVEYLSSMG